MKSKCATYFRCIKQVNKKNLPNYRERKTLVRGYKTAAIIFSRADKTANSKTFFELEKADSKVY
jgi:hypothetical protein